MNSKTNVKNTQFPCKTCTINENETSKTIRCDLYWVHMECILKNYINICLKDPNICLKDLN